MIPPVLLVPGARARPGILGDGTAGTVGDFWEQRASLKVESCAFYFRSSLNIGGPETGPRESTQHLRFHTMSVSTHSGGHGL